MAEEKPSKEERKAKKAEMKLGKKKDKQAQVRSGKKEEQAQE